MTKYIMRCDCGLGFISFTGELLEGGSAIKIDGCPFSLNDISCRCGRPMIKDAAVCSGVTLSYEATDSKERSNPNV